MYCFSKRLSPVVAGSLDAMHHCPDSNCNLIDFAIAAMNEVCSILPENRLLNISVSTYMSFSYQNTSIGSKHI